MSEMTKIAGVPDRDQALPGMAHFAGSGPRGRTCGGCAHLKQTAATREMFCCSKYQQLTGRQGNCIKRDCLACKYFQEKVKSDAQ